MLKKDRICFWVKSDRELTTQEENLKSYLTNVIQSMQFFDVEFFNGPYSCLKEKAKDYYMVIVFHRVRINTSDVNFDPNYDELGKTVPVIVLNDCQDCTTVEISFISNTSEVRVINYKSRNDAMLKLVGEISHYSLNNTFSRP